MPLGRQAQDTEPLQLFQQAQGALEAVAAAGRPPAQVLADGTPQLGAAQLGEAPDGDLDVSELLAGEALAQKGGGFEILDQRVHASRSPRPYLGKPAGICQVLPGGISGSCNPLQAKDVWAGDENLTIHHLHLMPLLARMLPPIPGRRRPVLASLASRTLAAFPETTAGRPPHYAFRGLLGVYSRCGLRAR